MSNAPTFSARLIGIVLAAGIALAGVFAVLTAYAPDLADGQDGGAHALSNAGTGFSGIARLAQATGVKVSFGRDDRYPPAGGLLVLTPEPGTDPARVDALIAARVAQKGPAPVLIILPKWRTGPLRTHRGWVEQAGEIPGAMAAASVSRRFNVGVLEGTSAPCCVVSAEGRLRFATPRRLRTLIDPRPTPVLVAPGGAEVMGWSRTDDVYVLAEPDLLNNAGIRDPATARTALAMLKEIGDGALIFDLTLNGLGRSQNLARLAFEPPFLALTLCLVAAAALAGLQAAIRFGSPRGEVRAIAFGKRALVDNAAELIRSARREPAMAARFATLMLDEAAASRGAPPGLERCALGEWLDRRATDSPPFAELDAAAGAARRREDGVAAARALHAWKEDVTHDR